MLLSKIMPPDGSQNAKSASSVHTWLTRKPEGIRNGGVHSVASAGLALCRVSHSFLHSHCNASGTKKTPRTMHIQPKPRISFGNEVSVDPTLRGANDMRRSMSAVGETPQSSVKDLIRLDHAADPERVGSQGRWGDDSAAAIDAPGGYLIALRPSTPARLW